MNENMKNTGKLRKKLYRARLKQSKETNLEFNHTNTPFKNRMSQWRALRNIKESLPKTPTKRAAVISA